MTSNVDLERHLEDGERLLGAALEAVFPGEFTVQRSTEVSEEERPALEVGDGHAALEPVHKAMRVGLSRVVRPHLVWRVYHEVDDSDDSVGMVGTALVPAEPACTLPRMSYALHEGCYTHLGDAVRHIVHDLVDRRVDVAMETAGYDLAIARGEL